MRTIIKKATLAAALALVGVNGAEASIVAAQTATGSEAILSVVNKTTLASVMQDLGEFRSEVSPGDAYTLNAIVTQFISDSGGLSNIAFAVTAGGATGSTAAGIYLHSSANAGMDLGTTTDGAPNNSKGTFLSTRNNMIISLNGTNPSDTDTAVNAAYGPFTGLQPNYTASNNYRWGFASGANAIAYDTLGGVYNALTPNLLTDLNLYTIQFLASNTGNSDVISLGSKASLVLNDPTNGSQLVITSTVPLPASIWLLGTACAGLLGRRQLRKRAVA